MNVPRKPPKRFVSLKPLFRRACFQTAQSLRPSKWIIFGTITSLSLSFGIVELFARLDALAPAASRFIGFVFMLLVFVFWIAAYAVPLALVFIALRVSFRRRSYGPVWPRFISIIVSYFSIMLVFSAFYYALAIEGDYHDAASKFIHYKYQAIRVKAGLMETQPYRKGDERSFRGMEARFYSGVDWPVDDHGKPLLMEDEAAEIPLPELMAAAGRPMDQVVKFIPSARAPIFRDCVYFSAVTLATVGYGDISPRAGWAKMASAVEALMGIALLVVALGMLFGNWRPDAIELDPQTAMQREAFKRLDERQGRNL